MWDSLIFVPLILVLYAGSLLALDFELPKTVKPLQYNLTITPNLKEGTYSGTVKINVNVTKPTYSITLHSKNLEITTARIDSNKKVNISTNHSYDFLTLSFSKMVKKGRHTIKLAFNGDMKNKSYGFFRGYEDVDGEREYFGSTFFEPINARVAFPCFDEPSLKARFFINIAKPNGYVALSNMNQIAETPIENGYTYVRFGKTKRISTYLVFFFVGNYSFVEDFYIRKDNKAIPVRMYSPPAKIQNVAFGVRQISTLLKWYANYTGFDYMLPKLDYITINSNFHMDGGMENWGAITSSEDVVFYNDSMSKLKQNRAFNMAHEIGHTWFGNLVTTASWGQFWLNEGFTRFMDRKSVEVYKQREESVWAYTFALHNALWRDDDLTAKPLVWKIENVKDVFEILDIIAYEKGCSILGMVEDLIGENRMQDVIQLYVKKYRYKNVVSQNFIDLLQRFVSFNATDFLVGFVQQSGYPLISVSYLENDSEIVLTKSRFLRMGQEDNQTTWSIPIKYVTDLSNKPQILWFNSSTDQLILKFATEIEWIKLNIGRRGYYRTNYPKKMWRRFNKIIKSFDINDRINLLDDSMALFRSGHLDCRTTFNLMNYLYDEERYEAWQVAKNNFKEIRLGLLQHNLTIDYLKTYITELIDKQYKANSWEVEEEETIKTKNNRETIFNLACYYGHVRCQKKIRELWNLQDTLPVDIRDILLANEVARTIDYNVSVEIDLKSVSEWFGADASAIPKEPTFRWPKYVMENCNQWLKEQFDD